jgi:hypothetical protein
METLLAAEVPFMVGGAYALAHYTGIVRHTKDLDLFLVAEDLEPARRALEMAGYVTEMMSDLWLAKAVHGEAFVDLIFSSGNGAAPVDRAWLENAQSGEVFGLAVKLCPPEEIIWQKAYVMERERYDGADVAHILYCRGDSLDWDRLLARFADHWQLLLSHLMLFQFIYPASAHVVPERVTGELAERLRSSAPGPKPGALWAKLCRGTLLSREQYRHDLEAWGLRDARLKPEGNVEPEQIDV